MLETLNLPLTFEKSILNTIQARYSARTYQPFPIPAPEKEELIAAMHSLSSARQRFAWFERPPGDILVERMGTYGFIKGANSFLVGVLKKGAKEDKGSAVRFGYSFEQIILKATELGLGTCWLGGTFNPLIFAKDINLQRDEQIVMASPVGFTADHSHFINDISVQVAESRTRLPWDTIFFKEYLKEPLSEEEAGDYAQPLEMVRLAPSAVNTQPWRVICHTDGFHFYGMDIRYYGIKRIDFLRNNDLGIAMSHFALSCHALDLPGGWKMAVKPAQYEGLAYIASWIL